MKFGKRSDSEGAGGSGANAPSADDSLASPAAPPLPPVPESPPAEAEYEPPGGPVGEELPFLHAEPIVEGEAYEVPADEPTSPSNPSNAPETLTVHQHEPAPPTAAMPFPVAEQPVSVVTPGPGPAPVTTLGASGEAFASGHAATHPAGPAPSWQEPMMELADERPELVVAAAFVGGLLAAMILRRLGN
jgi:hypothetical protein